MDPFLLPLLGLTCQPTLKLSGGSDSAPGRTVGRAWGLGLRTQLSTASAASVEVSMEESPEVELIVSQEMD